MHSRFDSFRATVLGQHLEALILDPDRYREYAALSRAGVPAVAAIVHDVQTCFPEVLEDQAARQFCGAAVAEVMRQHFHTLLQPRGRVPGGVFTYGAVWSPLPDRKSFPDLIAALAACPGSIAALFSALTPEQRLQRPACGGFSAHEHVCHLRDLDEVHQQRIGLILGQEMPVLPSVNGVALAVARRYHGQPGAAALRSLHLGRQALVALVQAIPAEGLDHALSRIGLRDGQHRVTLRGLIDDIHHHDQTHLLELQELYDEVSNPTEMQCARSC